MPYITEKSINFFLKTIHCFFWNTIPQVYHSVSKNIWYCFLLKHLSVVLFRQMLMCGQRWPTSSKLHQKQNHNHNTKSRAQLTAKFGHKKIIKLILTHKLLKNKQFILFQSITKTNKSNKKIWTAENTTDPSRDDTNIRKLNTVKDGDDLHFV